ncbi:hypothetical protein QQF64_002732 [Cirrhinus molitorella]|uniref:Uncharacterized protein n=1 Tax=Cirrhinus molitorella TaxID=172907 RepID=A0ABR3MR05_9TELE
MLPCRFAQKWRVNQTYAVIGCRSLTIYHHSLTPLNHYPHLARRPSFLDRSLVENSRGAGKKGPSEQHRVLIGRGKNAQETSAHCTGIVRLPCINSMS